MFVRLLTQTIGPAIRCMSRALPEALVHVGQISSPVFQALAQQTSLRPFHSSRLISIKYGLENLKSSSLPIDHLDPNERAIADSFFQENAKNPCVVAIIRDLLHYRRVQLGSGLLLGKRMHGEFNYTILTLDSEFIGSSLEPAALKLDQVKDIQPALIGMQEGELRVLFVHPTLAQKIFGLSKALAISVELIHIHSLS